MRLLLGLAAIVGFGAFAWFLVYMGMMLERASEKRNTLKQAGLTKDSAKLIKNASLLMRDALYSSDYENPNLLNDATAREMTLWLNDYKKEISK